MPMEKIEFEFPTDDGDNEVVIEGSNAVEINSESPENVEIINDDSEIEVIDDTPKADQNRKKSDPPEDVSEDELSEYSEKVAKRIKHISKGYHDERREKEQAIRERGELESYARKLITDNENLRKNVGQSQASMFKQAKVTVARDMEIAKTEYKQAYEAGNGEALLAAQEKLNTASIRSDKLSNMRPPPLQKQVSNVQQSQENVKPTQKAPQVDSRAKEWADKNTWFGQDKQMTALALGFHNELVEDKGFDPTSDEYYESVDSRMREVFPDKFEDASNKDDGTKAKKSHNVVAAATRSTSPKKVKLTRTQVSIAKTLGVPLEDYAKQVANDMSRKG